MPTRSVPPPNAPVANVDSLILPRLETFNKIRPRKNRGKERKKEKFFRRRPRRRNRAAVFSLQFDGDAPKIQQR